MPGASPGRARANLPAAVTWSELQPDETLARLRERIVAFAASRLSRDAAEDLAQEVLMLLHEKYRDVSTPGELLPLALQITRFKIMSLRRKMVRRGEYTQISVDEIQLPDFTSNPGTYAEKKLMLERLHAALKQMGERCRELFRLKLEGRSFPEIQAEMKVRSINTIYTWDLRCRKQLIELMGGSWEAPQ